MKHVERVILAIFALIAISCFIKVVDVFFVANGWKGLGVSDWAAWVQAIGSIVAISVGFRVAARQTRVTAYLAYKERIDRDADKLTAAFIICTVANEVACEVVEAFANPDSASFYLENLSYQANFDGVISSLAAIPVHEVRSARAVTGILALLRCVERLKSAVVYHREDAFFTAHDFDEIYERIDKIDKIRGAAVGNIIAAVDDARDLQDAIRDDAVAHDFRTWERMR